MPKAEDYQSLSSELDNVLAALQHSEVQIDEATVLYERGLKLIAKLESHVQSAENKLQKIRLDVTRKSVPAKARED